MKAWLAREKDEFCATVVFAETRGKAKALALYTEACEDQEYMESFADDLKDDKEMVYSRAVLDRELKQYTGKLFAPAEERYR